MRKFVLPMLMVGLAGCGAQVDGFQTKQIYQPYGGITPAVVGTGTVRSAVASQTVAQPVIVQQTVPVTRNVVSTSVVAQNVPVTRLVPTTSVVQVPRTIAQVVPVQSAVNVPRLATVPAQVPVVYQQYCSPWVAASGLGGLGYGGLGYGGLGLGGLGYGGLGYGALSRLSPFI